MLTQENDLIFYKLNIKSVVGFSQAFFYLLLYSKLELTSKYSKLNHAYIDDEMEPISSLLKVTVPNKVPSKLYLV